MQLKQHLTKIKNALPDGVRLVAVSKFHPAEAIRETYDCGQRIFGESKAQELQAKVALLPADIEWHFIGHLQSNKIKYIIPFISLIHSIDSIKLLEEVNKQAAKHNRTVSCLLEIHIAQEESKYGFSIEEARTLFEENVFERFDHVSIKGFMGMASLTDDAQQIRKEFHALSSFFNKIIILRERLRVMEQKINSSNLQDEEKIVLQQYITRCYGSLTSFNILFRNKGQIFVGEGRK